MPSVAEGNYNGTIAYTEWFKSRSGTVGLNVFVDIELPGGETERLKGTVWVTKKTTTPRPHKDGTPGRSQCEQQLNNCGYTAGMENIGEIGYSVSLEGNAVRVSVKEDDGERAQPGEMRIAFFNAKQMRRDVLADALAGILGKSIPKREPEGDDDVPGVATPKGQDDDSVPFEEGSGFRRRPDDPNIIEPAPPAPAAAPAPEPEPPPPPAPPAETIRSLRDECAALHRELVETHGVNGAEIVKGYEEDFKVKSPYGAATIEKLRSMREWLRTWKSNCVNAHADELFPDAEDAH